MRERRRSEDEWYGCSDAAEHNVMLYEGELMNGDDYANEVEERGGYRKLLTAPDIRRINQMLARRACTTKPSSADS